jgi:hypothetical protein
MIMPISGRMVRCNIRPWATATSRRHRSTPTTSRMIGWRRSWSSERSPRGPVGGPI